MGSSGLLFRKLRRVGVYQSCGFAVTTTSSGNGKGNQQTVEDGRASVTLSNGSSNSSFSETPPFFSFWT